MRQIKRMGAAIAAAAMLFSLIPSEIPVPAEAKIVTNPYSWDFADERNEIVSGAAYTMMVRLSGKFITAAEDGNVHQWENLGDASQQWIITKIGNGACKIVSAQNPQLSLTVANGDSTNGNNIYLSEYEDLPSQHFILHRTDDAYYITAECSGNAALDVYDISHENGANIDQWDYWGGEGQKFYIRPVDSKYTLLRGDMNNDGVVNAFDAAIMKRAVSEGFDDVAGKVADMNGDGANTSQDIRTITDFLLGKDSYQTLAEIPYEKEYAAYLFTYFLGNNPDQERMSYAVSLDGYHFKALNNGREVYKSSVGTGCLRDPYIFKGEDGLYYLLATDMKSSLGWSSNRNIISAKSTDLVHWFDETLIEIANKYPLMQGADRAWAPQAIYDPEKESYMIYYAARVPGRDDRTIMYYAYSKDMKTLDTEPQLLFAPKNGDDAIDSDIIYQNGKYYMYYKNETNKRIYLATADHANGPYTEIKQVSEGNIGVEGPNIYNLIGTDKWLMMSDAYGNGYYVMQETTDLENFKTLDRNSYSFDFTPRHGYVIPITDDQYDALVSAFPSDSISPRNTGMQKVKAVLAQGESAALPDTVTAQYSNGGTAQFPVEWNAAELAAVDTSKPGKYTVTGKVNANPYANPFIAERADPHVVKGDDGYYYFTASYPAYGDVNKGYDKIILRRSQTVAGLADAEEKTIWQA
ncbi:MAG: RICIN domain-containing protein, partial [Oscillospiraceae bacterium]|nr:RICIN domain-containing protein [Oscillospiraceae bacterium]